MEWLLWTDIETTGLDINNSTILQIACVLTNFDLSVQFTIPEINIKTTPAQLEKMDSWCKQQHRSSGLVDKVLSSETSLQDAESIILSIVNHHLSLNDTVYIAGNSVHFDKRFIDKYMPYLSKRLSYRIVDVSSFSIVFKNMYPEIYEKRPQKRYSHTAQNDIYESINEYCYYTEFFNKVTR